MLFIPRNVLVGKPLHRKIIEMLRASVTVSTGSTGRDLFAVQGEICLLRKSNAECPNDHGPDGLRVLSGGKKCS